MRMLEIVLRKNSVSMKLQQSLAVFLEEKFSENVLQIKVRKYSRQGFKIDIQRFSFRPVVSETFRQTVKKISKNYML